MMIGDKPAAYLELTPIQRRVFDVIHQEHGRPISTEEICARTLLSPDVVVKATTVLVQRDLIEVYDPAGDESELQVELAGLAK